MKRDTGQRERERGKATKRAETREEKRTRRKEKRGWTERKREKGIMQLLEETDRLKTFRGGICRGDPKILSPLKRI